MKVKIIVHSFKYNGVQYTKGKTYSNSDVLPVVIMRSWVTHRRAVEVKDNGKNEK